MIPPRSVLVVDPSEETREVLRTALERQGVRFLAADRPDRGLAIARRDAPDVIVVDADSGGEACRPFSDEAAERTGGAASLVLLGTLRRDEAPPVGSEVVPKPYHYGPLIRRIEELLDAVRPPLADAA